MEPPLDVKQAFCRFPETEWLAGRKRKCKNYGPAEDLMMHLASLWAVIRRIGVEPIVWLGGLFVLCLLDPSGEPHYRICPFALAGIDWCPGCGLGRSISLLFRGEFAASLHSHWFGLPAAAILLHRSCSLAVHNWKRATVENSHHL
jgi:hypothetical protein